MSLRPPEDADILIDYDDQGDEDRDLDGDFGRSRRRGYGENRHSVLWTDPRIIVPLMLLLSAVFLIAMALRARGGNTEADLNTSNLAQRVEDAQLRAGFDGLDITEADGVVYCERLDRTETTNGNVDLPCFGVFEMKEGKIHVWRDYFDMGTFVDAMRPA